MARDYWPASGREPKDPAQDPDPLWHRLDSWRHVCTRGDAFAARDRNGRDVESRVDAACLRRGNFRDSQIAASETRAAGIPWTFSPVLDLGRQPLWPRFYETFGEDPYLATIMGVAFVRGFEGDDISSPDQVATSLKHYVGYSFPLNGRDRTPAWIPENYLREYFLPPFAAAVQAGARTVMVNSAEINGTPGHVNHHLLTEVLRGELGFKGFVVS